MQHHQIGCHCDDCMRERVETINEKLGGVDEILQTLNAEWVVSAVLNGEINKAKEHINHLNDATFMKLRASLDVVVSLMDHTPDLKVAV